MYILISLFVDPRYRIMLYVSHYIYDAVTITHRFLGLASSTYCYCLTLYLLYNFLLLHMCVVQVYIYGLQQWQFFLDLLMRRLY